MRVIHIITRMIIGGAQENTLFNCLDLRAQFDDDVLLVTGPSLGPEGDLLTQGRAGELPIHLVPELARAIHPVRDWQALRSLRRIIREFKPDVVHTHSAKGGMLGRRAAYLERVPAIVHTVHGAPFHPYQPLLAQHVFRLCETRAARWCDRLISVADAMTDLMVKANVAPAEKFKTIYSGMDVEPFLIAAENRSQTRAALGIEPHHVVFGKIARLFKLKGHDDLITASKSLVAACPEVRFLFVGDGILREPLQRRIEQLGLRDYFIFTGLVPPRDVPPLIGAMDALVHTSYREGLARALPQALIAGRPVISYDVDGAREVAIDRETGYLVPPGDLDLLSRRMIELAQSRDDRQRMGAAGQARFTDRFRHQTMTAEIRAVYEQILTQPARRP
ncbi:MAG: glycosyltransferase family 4 protein [Planctomycetaceae bacterium]